MSAAAAPVLTFADLDCWSSSAISLAVIGQPVAHSLSPAMHNAALAEMAKTNPAFGDWRYFKFEIAPDELTGALAAFREARFLGLNLTIPHKALVVPHLDSHDSFVDASGAANTLKLTGAGWHGSNTDGYGLATALQEDLKIKLRGTPVILLGTGGAARAAAAECLRQACASLWIGYRTPASLAALRSSLRARPAATVIGDFELAHPPADLPSGALVINATSLGLRPEDPGPVDLKKIPAPAGVFDMIYRPPETALLRQAAALGIPHANGLSMLVHQGAKSLEIWSGATVPVAVMQAAARAALASP